MYLRGGWGRVDGYRSSKGMRVQWSGSKQGRESGSSGEKVWEVGWKIGGTGGWFEVDERMSLRVGGFK